MKAALISLGSVSSQWTLKAMKKHFDSVDALDVRRFEIEIGQKTRVLYEGEDMKPYDCVFVKGSFRYADLLTSITAYCRGKSFLAYKTQSFSVAHDKILTHIYLSKYEVPQPKTYITSSPSAGKKIIEKMNFPVIMKLPRGSHGKGVMFADSYASASSVLDTLDTLKQPFLIQEYIETGGEDLRLIVIGDKVVACMKRKANGDEVRSNIHSGGQACSFTPDLHTQKMAIRTAKAVGADICGVDILETVKGPVVIEANLSPGLQGITKATGIDIAERIAQYLAEKTKDFMESGKEKRKKEIIEDLNGNSQEIISNLDFRGNRILLPEVITTITKISEDDEMVISVKKGGFSVKRLSL